MGFGSRRKIRPSVLKHITFQQEESQILIKFESPCNHSPFTSHTPLTDSTVGGPGE